MHSDATPEIAGDPIRQLLDGPSPERRLRLRHWVGIGCLACAVAVAAIAIPPLVSPDDSNGGGVPMESTTPQAIGAPTGDPTATGSAVSPSATTSKGADPPADPNRSPAAPATTGARPSDPATSAPANAGDTPFSPITIEAEDPGNTLIGDATVATDCPTCSGGARVRYIDHANQVIVNVDVPTAGVRTIALTYECDGTREIKLSINESEPIVRTITGTSWTVPNTVELTATVPAGRVTLRYYDDVVGAPDLDKVTIS